MSWKKHRMAIRNGRKKAVVEVIPVGHVGDQEIDKVKGESVRKVDDTFTLGGHHYVYPFIPEGQDWIDKGLEGKDEGAIVVHETDEEPRMEKLHEPYEKAHAHAEMMEKRFRANPRKVIQPGPPWEKAVMKSPRRRRSRTPEKPDFFTGDSNAIDGMDKNREYFRDYKGLAYVKVDMSVDDYFDALQKAQPEGNWWVLVENDRYQGYADRMKAGEKADNPSLTYKYTSGFFGNNWDLSFGQEGRHRMLAARAAGMEKVPVFVVYSTRYLEKIEKAMTPKIREAIEKAESQIKHE